MKETKGLGGWLILPIIGFIVNILIYLYDLSGIFALNDFGWIMLIIVVDGLAIFLLGTTLFLIFKKQKEAPKWAMIAIGYNILIYFLIVFTSEAPFNFVWFFISLAWINYFRKSKRVKNTFVN